MKNKQERDIKVISKKVNFIFVIVSLILLITILPIGTHNIKLQPILTKIVQFNSLSIMAFNIWVCVVSYKNKRKEQIK